MYLKNLLSITILASFTLAVACGGAEESHDAMADAAPMTETEPAAEPMGDTFSLGGGTATEVHPGDAGVGRPGLEPVGELAKPLRFGDQSRADPALGAQREVVDSLSAASNG